MNTMILENTVQDIEKHFREQLNLGLKSFYITHGVYPNPNDHQYILVLNKKQGDIFNFLSTLLYENSNPETLLGFPYKIDKNQTEDFIFKESDDDEFIYRIYPEEIDDYITYKEIHGYEYGMPLGSIIRTFVDYINNNEYFQKSDKDNKKEQTGHKT